MYPLMSKVFKKKDLAKTEMNYSVNLKSLWAHSSRIRRFYSEIRAIKRGNNMFNINAHFSKDNISCSLYVFNYVPISLEKENLVSTINKLSVYEDKLLITVYVFLYTSKSLLRKSVITRTIQYYKTKRV